MSHLILAYKLEQEIIEATLRATDNHDIGAVVFECTELSPHAAAIQNAVRLPVYDFTTMINFMYSAAVRRDFTGLKSLGCLFSRMNRGLAVTYFAAASERLELSVTWFRNNERKCEIRLSPKSIDYGNFNLRSERLCELAREYGSYRIICLQGHPGYCLRPRL